jgi:hypothetical protein
MEIWLALFDKRKAELIAGGMTTDDADDVACTEIRRQIREHGFQG